MKYDIPIVSCEDDSASACLLAFRDLIYLIQTLTFVRFLELLSKVVFTDSPNIHHWFRGKNVLNQKKEKKLLNGMTSIIKRSSTSTTHCSASGGILGSPTSNVGHFIVLSEFIVASDDVWNQRQEEQERSLDLTFQHVSPQPRSHHLLSNRISQEAFLHSKLAYQARGFPCSKARMNV